MRHVGSMVNLRQTVDTTAARNLRLAAAVLGAAASVLEGTAAILDEDYGDHPEATMATARHQQSPRGTHVRGALHVVR